MRGRRRLGAGVALAWLAASLLVPAVAVAEEPGAPACLPPESALATTTGAPATTTRTVTDTEGGTLRVTEAAAGADAAGVAVDATDTWGRIAVAAREQGTLTIRYGRSEALTEACTIALDGRPSDVAIDPETGVALVTLLDLPALALVDVRAEPGRVVGRVELPAPGGHVVLDPGTRRAWVTLPEAGLLALVAPDPAAPAGWSLAGTVPAGAWPQLLAVDAERGRLIVSAQGQPPSAEEDQGLGAILRFTLGPDGMPIPEGAPIPASVPTGVAIDPVTGTAWVLENGEDRVLSLVFPAEGGEPEATRILLPYGDEAKGLNPVELVLLPADRELVVTFSSAVAPPIGDGLLAVLRLDPEGRAVVDRAIPAPRRTRGIALDPASGRVFVTAPGAGIVEAIDLDAPSAPPPPPPPIAVSMPSPLQISLAPEDVARTVGLSLLVLLLVGAPTPLFNETLESHVDEIGGWLRRLLRRRKKGVAAPGAADGEPATDQGSAADREGAGAPGLLARAGAAVRAVAAHPAGIVVYTAIGALIYSFLTPGFPVENGILVFIVAFIALGLAMAADILPGDRYVVRRYQAHGHTRVALWTLGLAAGCVLVSRLADLNPGYMYGMIGTYTFALALTREDEGRMEARGAVALLVLALAAWFLRIPFQPAPGVPADGAAAIVNLGLVGVFIVCVENLVFGLIPLSFMPGRRIFAWHRGVWALLWGAGLALFAHVLVYPVTVAQPNPDPAQLQVTLVGVLIYGAVAVLTWLAFRVRAARHPAEGGAGS